MSTRESGEPACEPCDTTPEVELVIESRPRDLGGLRVGRVLPSRSRRRVGPFIFLDHMGPATFPKGSGIDVLPHPHINLATVTYLFDGEIIHRDSLGSHQTIVPGAINWMTAGRGITHSERTGETERERESSLHGLQLWVALPIEHEETEPEFQHHPAASMPEHQIGSATLRVLAGRAYGRMSPVRTFSPLFYVEALIPSGSAIRMPDEFAERAAYVVSGVVDVGAERSGERRMLVFTEGAEVTLRAQTDTRVMLLGGERLAGERHMWWNFVSSSPARIEAAKADWKDGRFPTVPGDEIEFTPLPEG
ncbi:MAG: pirin family protein [Myxococcota bacterium]